jgi:hypothetical protein
MAISTGAALLGSAAIGALGGGSGSGGSQQTTSTPWGPQQEYLTHGFGQAKDALTNAQGKGTYAGPYTAGLNPFQTAGYNAVGDFAQNQGMQGANGIFNTGMGMIGLGSQFGANAGDIFNKASQDPTQQIIGNAGQYASNPYLDGQIDAASRDITRNLHEQQLPGLDMTATSTGNMNSSRTGVAQGIMERGAADRIGDISAQMRGNAYQNGLGMAQGQYNTGMSQMLGANGQLLQGGQFGADATSNGVSMGYGAGDAMARAGAGFQSQAQNEINGNRQQFQDQQNQPLDLISKYMQMINGNYGSSSNSSTSGGSKMMGALAGGLGGMGLYGKFQGMQGGQTPSTTTGGSPGYSWVGGGFNPDN